MLVQCPLCKNESTVFFQDTRRLYHICSICNGIFCDSKDLPDKDVEFNRYQHHQNNINDLGYLQFINPIIKAVQFNNKYSEIGLDFGAGSNPVLSKTLIDKGYNIYQYDPFFHPHTDLLQHQYDYIICCEVMEHFHNPAREFDLLKRMIRPGGNIYCMTSVYDPRIDFGKWYYKNDLTHVFFYQKETIYYIQKYYGFSATTIDGNFITFHTFR